MTLSVFVEFDYYFNFTIVKNDLKTTSMEYLKNYIICYIFLKYKYELLLLIYYIIENGQKLVD